jgi:RNA polymerase sigma-70 factor, ECF subfamily
MRMRDPESFDAFYAGCVRRVTSQLYALTGDWAEAEDAVQEAFARAWQRWGRISGYEDPEGWVRTVSYRIGVSSWRKRAMRAAAHRRQGPVDDLPELSPDYVAIVAALRKISADQRRAIVLYHLVGLSVTEVASETGASAAAVKARLARGRSALHTHLAEAPAGVGTQEALNA